MAISVEPACWSQLVERLTAAGVEHVVHSGVSVYFRDPDGARIELIAEPLGEMYGPPRSLTWSSARGTSRTARSFGASGYCW